MKEFYLSIKEKIPINEVKTTEDLEMLFEETMRVKKHKYTFCSK